MRSLRIEILLTTIILTVIDLTIAQTTVSSFYDVNCWSGQPNVTLNVSAHVPGTCANQYSFQCTNGSCIDISYWNDCVVDCSDGSDELCSPGLVLCDGCHCVLPEEVLTQCIQQPQFICSTTTVSSTTTSRTSTAVTTSTTLTPSTTVVTTTKTVATITTTPVSNSSQPAMTTSSVASKPTTVQYTSTAPPKKTWSFLKSGLTMWPNLLALNISSSALTYPPLLYNISMQSYATTTVASMVLTTTRYSSMVVSKNGSQTSSQVPTLKPTTGQISGASLNSQSTTFRTINATMSVPLTTSSSGSKIWSTKATSNLTTMSSISNTTANYSTVQGTTLAGNSSTTAQVLNTTSMTRPVKSQSQKFNTATSASSNNTISTIRLQNQNSSIVTFTSSYGSANVSSTVPSFSSQNQNFSSVSSSKWPQPISLNSIGSTARSQNQNLSTSSYGSFSTIYGSQSGSTNSTNITWRTINQQNLSLSTVTTLSYDYYDDYSTQQSSNRYNSMTIAAKSTPLATIYDECSAPKINITTQIVDSPCDSGVCFKCNSGEVFDFLSVWSNCHEDCMDGSDELCYPGQVKCDGINGCLCVNIDKITATENCPIIPQCLLKLPKFTTTTQPPTTTTQAPSTTTKIKLWTALDLCNPPSILNQVVGSCGNQTGSIYIKCGDGTCVSFEQSYMNCVYDCPDMVDEMCMPGLIKCDGCKCVPENKAKTLCTNYVPATTTPLSVSCPPTTKKTRSTTSMSTTTRITTTAVTTTIASTPSTTSQTTTTKPPSTPSSTTGSTPPASSSSTTTPSAVSSSSTSPAASSSSTPPATSSSSSSGASTASTSSSAGASTSSSSSAPSTNSTTTTSSSSAGASSTSSTTTSSSAGASSPNTTTTTSSAASPSSSTTSAGGSSSSSAASTSSTTSSGQASSSSSPKGTSSAGTSSTSSTGSTTTSTTTTTSSSSAVSTTTATTSQRASSSSSSSPATNTSTSSSASSTTSTTPKSTVSSSGSTSSTTSSKASSTTSSSSSATMSTMKSMPTSTAFKSTMALVGCIDRSTTLRSRIIDFCNGELGTFIQCGDGSCVPYAETWQNCRLDCNDGVDEMCWDNEVQCDDCRCVSSAVKDPTCKPPANILPNCTSRATFTASTTSTSSSTSSSTTTKSVPWTMSSSAATANACSSCSPYATCNRTGSYYKCYCNAGFVGNGLQCAVDECAQGMKKCGQNAYCDSKYVITEQQSLVTSFNCYCNTGFYGDGNVNCSKGPCELNTANCSKNADCVPDPKIPFKYSCVCRSGFVGDGVTCTSADGCKTQQPTCDSSTEVCVPTGQTTYRCDCNPNLFRIKGKCVTDPCISAALSCPENSICKTLNETYSCKCNDDYFLSGSSCVLHPCAAGTDNCSSNAICLPKQGTPNYDCACDDGYYGDGYKCVPDACLNDLSDCPQNSQCISQNNGSYTCRCNPNYYSKNGACILHPCFDTNSPPCSPQAKCLPDRNWPNLSERYACSCLSPYVGNGTICTLPSVTSAPKVCNKNTQWRCPISGNCIPKDWVLDNVKDCPNGEDENPALIDECALGKNKCDPMATCTNVPDGAYACKCKSGYVGNGQRCELPRSTTSGPPPVTSPKAYQCTGKVTEFVCTISKLCIPNVWVNDGIKDCPDGEDERTASFTKGRTMPTASTPKILSTKSKVCDFQCTSENKCIPADYVLDRIKDCLGGEDEDPVKVDECLYKKNQCHQNATCTKVPGGTYECHCKTGFTGNGMFCKPSRLVERKKRMIFL